MASFLVLLLLVLSTCAASSVFASLELQEVQVPEAIRVPPGYKLHLFLFARGYQLYRFNGSSWVDFSAKAKLFNKKKKVIGRHFYLPKPDPLGGQPSWKTLPSKGVPASLVTGVAVARVTVDVSAIAWVLLKATHHSGDKKYFGAVEYIQRINCSKGLAPSDTSGVEEGDVQKSSYTCNYVFYVPE